MSNRKTLKPAEGLKVRRPDGKHLAEAGESVEMTSYWVRRLRAGDVVEVTPVKSAPASSKPSAAADKKQG